MKKQIPLNNEERRILAKLTNTQLQFFSKLSQDKDFSTLKDVVNLLIDVEKNIFFATNESKETPDTLYALHAYSRGGIAKITTLVRIIVASSYEIEARENERLKRKTN
jgi:hypothetical protein